MTGTLVTTLLLTIVVIIEVKASTTKPPIDFPQLPRLKSNYGESCNKTIRCKTQSWLSCDHETHACQCAKPDEMTFDPIKNKCVVLIGERCKYGFDEEEGNLWFEKAECVKGAVCGPSGLCSCPVGYFEDTDDNNKKCTAIKLFGGSCKNRYQCNQDKFLNCVDGFCQCDLDSAIYNNATFGFYHAGTRTIPAGQCIGRVGSKCSYNSGKYCVMKASCEYEVCKCNNGYSETSDKLCGLGYDQKCSEVNICSDKLRCVGSQTNSPPDQYGRLRQQNVQCKCPNPEYQRYDEVSKSCPGVVGAPCDPNDTTSCTSDAQCIEQDNIFQCECRPGYVETTDERCEIAHGFRCDYTDSATVPRFQMCDQMAKLGCRGEKCSCPNEVDIYETERRQCSRPVGLRCKLSKECVANAFCLKSAIQNENIKGKCVCRNGFEAGRNHTCLPKKSETITDFRVVQDANTPPTTTTTPPITTLFHDYAQYSEE